MYRIVILVILMGFSTLVRAEDGVNSAQTNEALQSESTAHSLSTLQEITPKAINEECDNIQLAMGCCKICRKGKACGDSCISRSKTCHKGPGCACDG